MAVGIASQKSYNKSNRILNGLVSMIFNEFAEIVVVEVTKLVDNEFQIESDKHV